jgi:hypothetical protein
MQPARRAAAKEEPWADSMLFRPGLCYNVAIMQSGARFADNNNDNDGRTWAVGRSLAF